MKRIAFGSGVITTAAAMALLQGCLVSRINPDAAQQANATLDRLDARQTQSPPTRYEDQESRLWSDKPQYAALVRAVPVKRMRMISAVSPKYPTMLRLGHVSARVVISYVVGVDGRIEDARILESSDSRFNDSVLEAIRKFTFIPAQGVNGPIREIAMEPFNFVWSPKAQPVSSPSAQ